MMTLAATASATALAIMRLDYASSERNRDVVADE